MLPYTLDKMGIFINAGWCHILVRLTLLWKKLMGDSETLSPKSVRLFEGNHFNFFFLSHLNWKWKFFIFTVFLKFWMKRDAAGWSILFELKISARTFSQEVHWQWVFPPYNLPILYLLLPRAVVQFFLFPVVFLWVN